MGQGSPMWCWVAQWEQVECMRGSMCEDQWWVGEAQGWPGWKRKQLRQRVSGIRSGWAAR